MPLLHLPGTREKLIEMASPPGRVFSFAQTFGLGRIKDILDPPTQPVGCFGNLVPDRLEHPEHIVRVDLMKKQLP